MTKLYTMAAMSLDGFISGPEESGFDRLFAWYASGDVAVPTADRTFHMSQASATLWSRLMDRTGACLVGRRLFDLTNGWHGNPPVGKPHVVLTHKAPEGWLEPAVPFTFATEGIEDAVARAKSLAGDKWVSVAGGTMASQCLEAGLLDEIWVSLTPVLLGGGVRFLESVPRTLRGPLETVDGTGVTHLRYAVS
jgi:dihydrofolate reductase